VAATHATPRGTHEAPPEHDTGSNPAARKGTQTHANGVQAPGILYSTVSPSVEFIVSGCIPFACTVRAHRLRPLLQQGAEEPARVHAGAREPAPALSSQLDDSPSRHCLCWQGAHVAKCAACAGG